MQIYDYTTDTWARGAPINIPRANHACKWIGDKIGGITMLLIAGGVGNPAKPLDSTEIYDIKNRYWKMGPRLPYPTVGASFAFAKSPYDSSSLLVGGCQNNTD